MAIRLDVPLAWIDAEPDERAMLADLQGNILDGHGRRATRHIFFNFTDPAKGKEFVRNFAAQVTSSLNQLIAAKKFRDDHISGGPFISLLLSHAGYEALGVLDKSPERRPDSAFVQGMAARAARLNDPLEQELEPPYRERIHAMILIGADPDGPTSWYSRQAVTLQKKIVAKLGMAAAHVVTIETGRAILREGAGSTIDTPIKQEGIEHFGYVDGRSQPLMLTELIKRERDESDGISVWNPIFPLEQVLVADPGAPAATRDTAFGSFFVFRKLEQNVDGFKTAEEELGGDLGLGNWPGPCWSGVSRMVHP